MIKDKDDAFKDDLKVLTGEDNQSNEESNHSHLQKFNFALSIALPIIYYERLTNKKNCGILKIIFNIKAATSKLPDNDLSMQPNPSILIHEILLNEKEKGTKTSVASINTIKEFKIEIIEVKNYIYYL